MAKSKVQAGLYAIGLSVTTIVLLGAFVVSGLASLPNPKKFGFKNTTANVSNEFYTQVTPADYTFAIWGVIYAWQTAWIIYAWTFLCRPNAPKTISSGVYVGYSIVNTLNITWIYVWGNELVVPACVVLFIFNLVFYPTIGLLFNYFNKIEKDIGSIEKFFTRALPMNGLCLYNTWSTIAVLINLTAAVQTTTSISNENMATVSLTILLVALLAYFVLENTVLDNFGFRYVFTVYPVVIWALVGVLEAHWGKTGEERNNIYSLILLGLAVMMFAAKLILVPIYVKFRPRPQPKCPDVRAYTTLTTY